MANGILWQRLTLVRGAMNEQYDFRRTVRYALGFALAFGLSLLAAYAFH